MVGNAELGADPGGFYAGPNMNAGQMNPSSFHQGQTLAERP